MLRAAFVKFLEECKLVAGYRLVSLLAKASQPRDVKHLGNSGLKFSA